MNDMEKYTTVIAGKKISLLTHNVSLLHDQALLVQQMYLAISEKYGNKLDRESVFLFIVFTLLHEKDLSVAEDAVISGVSLIHSLANDIDVFCKGTSI
jgi:hypothetical protein